MKAAFYFLPIVMMTTLLLSGCGSKGTTETTRDSLALDYTVVNTLPHNPSAFTQGLIVYDNKVIESTGGDESTGHAGDSWIAEVDPATGDHHKKVTLEGQYFGEGITVLNNKIYQLTWKSKIGFIYDARTYKKTGDFHYNTEGWGITHDNQYLIMSDGSEKIYFLDSVTQKEVKSIRVTDGGNAVKNLNELEYINGYIFANVWQTDVIVKVDPATGKVVGRIDLRTLADRARSMYQEAEVLNGIAYDKNSKSILVTGKHWPQAYLIKLK